MRICPICKKKTLTDTTLGEVCTNYDNCGYIDGMDLGPRKKKPLNPLDHANRIIQQLKKRISDLENANHYCNSCGNVTRPSHPADGC